MRLIVLLTALLVTFSANCQQQQFTIYFENDEFAIDQNDRQIISDAAVLIRDSLIEVNSIEIFGYADTNASQAYNIELSKKRAQAVEEQLGLFLSKSNNSAFNVKWYGESPSNSNTALNYATRSVDIIINYSRKEIQTASIKGLLEQLYTPFQHFMIDPNRDTILTGEDGTIIMIPANSFYIAKSCANEKIDIVLQESYDPATFILNNLNTTNNGVQLESGGMVFIKAHQCNRILTPKENAQFTFMFPTDALLPEMKLYNGARDPQGNINWQASNATLRQLNSEDMSVLLNRWNFVRSYERNYCSVFCRIGNFLNPTRDHATKYTFYRRNYRAYRKYIDSMCLAYGVTNSYDLLQAMEKENREKLEASVANGDVQNWSYYVTTVNSLNWMNCDRYLTLPEKEKTTITVQQTVAENVTVNLLFKQYKSMMKAGTTASNQFEFANIGKGEWCYIVAMKYENGIPYLSVQHICVKEGMVIQPEFKEYTVETLKEELANLGG